MALALALADTCAWMGAAKKSVELTANGAGARGREAIAGGCGCGCVVVVVVTVLIVAADCDGIDASGLTTGAQCSKDEAEAGRGLATAALD